MLVVYEGPPDSYDSEVAQALAAARESTIIELPDERESTDTDTLLATDTGGEASGYLEPGRVYDLPPRLAVARLETSAWWSRVSKISSLSVEQLHQLAGDRGVKGHTKLNAKELAKAVSSAPPATLPDPAPAEDVAPAGGDTAPDAETTTAGGAA